MADNDFLYSGLAVNVRHVPDSSLETDAQGNRYSQELPGFIEFGVDLDGHFEVIARRKAAGMFADIERVKQRAQSEQSSAPQGEQSTSAATTQRTPTNTPGEQSSSQPQG